MQLLAGRTAVITGAAQGLGHSIAAAFAAHGANVVLGDIAVQHVAVAAESLNVGERAVGLACDVTDADDMFALLNAAVERYGSLDVLVNNAGFTRDATMRKMSEQDFDSVIAVHLKGTWLGTRAVGLPPRRSDMADPDGVSTFRAA